MSYIFYNPATNSFGRETAQPYTMDGKPGPLPEGTVELQIVREAHPADIPEGFVAAPSKTVNLETRQLVYSFEIVKIPVPTFITKEQFINRLLAEGLYENASAYVNTVPEGPQKTLARAKWLHGQTVPRDGLLMVALLTHLGKDSEAIDEFFRNAANL